ncbi:DNA polymerase III subunit gamma/tau [Brucepastera parasyntrophica]|uniref:DNA polymerase III subunit gamma/tau n=1 Tax=Brucepastera parasyntrophica TaxID=2880008 RepID=UPI00210A2935|nr:DNA polymerase III subunit gamma/tau [Brucepastera parasyntrophica]ULQ58987.1 DNA polymerase III subunit gamma/tau [Brucepastera parasyntrophica]
MEYEVTATRRRPQRFEDMVGQDFVVATLQKSVSSGKIAHAYLFSGPRGCGKTSAARILAKALNCEQGPTQTPCGHCTACTEITRGASLDVIEIDGASNTSVNDVRQIKDEVQFPPNSLRYKVYIIDEVHMLSTSAFNALLKTIEEPPPYVVFIFATTEIHKVPATIKSRCQQFNFRLVPVELLKKVLAETAEETGIQAEDEALYWIARQGNGSVRDSYTLFDQVAAFSDGSITYEKIRDKLGLTGIDRINPLIEACADKDPEKALAQLDEILGTGVSVEQFTIDTAEYFRNLLLVKSGITKESLLGQNVQRFSARVLQSWTPVQIERALAIMLQLFRDIRYSLDSRYELELAVSRLSWISDYVSSAEMKSAIIQARKLLENDAGGTGDTHPFADADHSAGNTESSEGNQGMIRDTSIHMEEQSSGVTPEKEENEAPSAGDPFAELKQRFAAGTQKEPVSSEKTEEEYPAPHDSGEISPAADDEPAPESLEDLQEKIVSFFQETKNVVAAGLTQSFNWRREGGTLSFSVDTPFVLNQLENERREIVQELSRLLKNQITLEIKLDTEKPAEKEENPQGEIPLHVEMVRQMFRGSVIPQ